MSKVVIFSIRQSPWAKIAAADVRARAVSPGEREAWGVAQLLGVYAGLSWLPWSRQSLPRDAHLCPFPSQKDFVICPQTTLQLSLGPRVAFSYLGGHLGLRAENHTFAQCAWPVPSSHHIAMDLAGLHKAVAVPSSGILLSAICPTPYLDLVHFSVQMSFLEKSFLDSPPDHVSPLLFLCHPGCRHLTVKRGPHGRVHFCLLF